MHNKTKLIVFIKKLVLLILITPVNGLCQAGAKKLNAIPLFDETSITRDYLNKHNGLKWKNTLGDWIDKNEVSQGNKPWATAQVNRETNGIISIDVTDLAKYQQAKKNQLIILSATVPVKIASRESPNSPTLTVFFEDGSIQKLKPVLDSYIARSTVKNINTDILSFDTNDNKAFIQFKIPEAKIKKALLEIWPIKTYGSGNIQVYTLAHEEKKLFSTSIGLANSVSSYSQLVGYPSIIFLDTFDSKKIKSEWFWQEPIRDGQLNNGYLTGEIDPKGKSRSIFNIRYFFAKHLSYEPTEIYFRYSIRFHKNFIYATQGGKLPGQSGTYNTCGWGGRTPSDTCRGWSARMHYKPPIKSGPYIDLIPIGTYLYHLGQKGKYGDTELWQAFCKMEEWCELEQYVKLNTPGKSDGILRGYHNGQLVFERMDIKYRNDDGLKIEDIWSLVYHGGTGFPTKTISADIDNVVISKEYIGSLNNSKTVTSKNKSLKINSLRSVLIPPKIRTKKISTVKQGKYINSNITEFIKANKELKTNSAVFYKNSYLEKIPNNTAVDLGNFSCTAPKGDNESCTKVTDYSGMIYDQNHHQILLFGGGHATTFTDSVFLFNFDSLNWKEDYPPTPCTKEFMSKANFDSSRSTWINGPEGTYPRPISRHTYDLLAVATNIPELIMLIGPNGRSTSCPPSSWYSNGNPKVAHYHLKKKKWEFSKTAETDGRPFYKGDEYTSSEYDPISGMIIILGRYGLYLYNPFTREKIRLFDRDQNKNLFSENLGYANELVYFPPNDKMYYFDRKSKSVFELTLNRKKLTNSSLIKLETKGDYPGHPEPGYAYDSKNALIGGALSDNKFYFFNPKTNSWSNQEVSGGNPGTMEFHNIIYDPVDNVFIFLTKGFKTWAYRYKS